MNYFVGYTGRLSFDGLAEVRIDEGDDGPVWTRAGQTTALHLKGQQDVDR